MQYLKWCCVPLTLAMIVMVCLLIRSLCVVCFHSSILVTKFVCFKHNTCCVLLPLPIAGHFLHSFVKTELWANCAALPCVSEQQVATEQLLTKGGDCIACREPPPWLHGCPVSKPHIARRLLTPSAAWALLLLLLQAPYPSPSSRPASQTEASRSCRYKVLWCVYRYLLLLLR